MGKSAKHLSGTTACVHSHDYELKKAALNVSSADWINNNSCWPIHIYRDVILLASEFYRRKHPERAKILPQRKELKQALDSTMNGDGKIPQRIQRIVGKICFSHGIAFSEMLALLEPVDSLLGYEFHPRFVSVLLCLGDLCDLDNGRFNLMAIEVFGGLTKSNLVHYYKHESVTSFVIQKDMISVTFDIQNRKIKDELKNNEHAASADKDLQDFCDSILLETQNWISWMSDIIKNIKLYWNELCISDMEPFTPSLNYKILVEGKESTNFNCRFFCKEFKVENAGIKTSGYNMTPRIVDYWGGNTRNLLNISRDSLSQEQTENNKTIFSKARKYMAEVYYLVLSSLLTDDKIKKWHNDISEFMKPWLAKNSVKKSLDISKDVNVFLINIIYLCVTKII